LLKGGNIPVAYVYPKGLRETRDLLRSTHVSGAISAPRSITHVQIVNAQFKLLGVQQELIYAKNRAELKIAERFGQPATAQRSVDSCYIGRAEKYPFRSTRPPCRTSTTVPPCHPSSVSRFLNFFRQPDNDSQKPGAGQAQDSRPSRHHGGFTGP